MKELRIIIGRKDVDSPKFNMYPGRPTSTYERTGIKPVSDAARLVARTGYNRKA